MTDTEKILKAIELLQLLHDNCMVPNLAHDAVSTCSICRLLGQLKAPSQPETNIRELAMAAMKAYEITLSTRFDKEGHAEPWRNEVAKELNVILERSICDGSDLEFGKCALSICARVAQFEEIRPYADHPMKSKVELIIDQISDLCCDTKGINTLITIEYLEEIQAHTQERINALRGQAMFFPAIRVKD